MPVTDSILRLIRDNGYAVSIHRLTSAIAGPGGVSAGSPYVELHAVKLDGPDQQHVSRVWGEGEQVEYLAACRLAESVGIRLEG